MQYGVKLSGVASQVPSKVVTNNDLAEFLDTNDDWITERTGIKQRHVCLDNEDGLTLSTTACKKILDSTGINPEDIDLIVVATSTPDCLYPSTACRLQAELSADNAVCFDLSAACSGFIYSVLTASQFIQLGTYKKALVVGVDIHSRFMDWEDRSTAILFGDGAGAVLLEQTDINNNELLGSHLESDGKGGADLCLKTTGVKYPSGKNTQEVDTVYMNGRKIYQFAVRKVPAIINEVSAKAGIETSEINYLLCHQANQRILDAVTDRMGWESGRCLSNIAKYGNTSAASIPLVWDEFQDSIKTGDIICLAGFGAGLTAGSILWQIGGRK